MRQHFFTGGNEDPVPGTIGLIGFGSGRIWGLSLLCTERAFGLGSMLVRAKGFDFGS